ncbi:MAG: tetratricopeptide repeat protein [Planctomycetota bacterium]
MLNNLGAWARIVDHDEARAEALMRRGLDVGERVFSAQHPLLATSLTNVALYDEQRGDLTRARERLTRALAILEATRGPTSADANEVRSRLQAIAADRDH